MKTFIIIALMLFSLGTIAGSRESLNPGDYTEVEAGSRIKDVAKICGDGANSETNGAGGVRSGSSN